jgi:hypothetical protein
VYAEILARESNQAINDPVKLMHQCWRGSWQPTRLLPRLATPARSLRRRTGSAREAVLGGSTIYPPGKNLSAKVRSLIDFLAA